MQWTPEGTFAHTPVDGSTEWHDLRAHLEAVADLAEINGRKFGAGNTCRAVGLAHDLAKADPQFQNYLRGCHEGRAVARCPHAAPSAAVLADMIGAASLAIVGHHSGLPDRSNGKQRVLDATSQSVAEAVAFAKKLVFPRGKEIEAEFATIRSPLGRELFIRMVFSALVDADFLDTETHCNAGRTRLREWSADLASLSARLCGWLEKFDKTDGKINQCRREVLLSCRQKAQEPQGAFRLTVPTGGGKTLSSLTFALDHAVHHHLDRVIIAIPYTSIIDQTADVYEEVFGQGVVLEHHSAVEPEDMSENMSSHAYRRRLAAENWDAPIVVTTMVQLFESLFANQTSKCRKLHNIARSVIVLDEIQTLPVELLTPTLDVLEELIARYGVTVVFCTATQPDYMNLGTPLLANAQEIIAEPELNFVALKRVNYHMLPSAIGHANLAFLVSQHRQALCILNSRKDAVKVARTCEVADIFHLSTLMCPDHRRKVLARVRDRLKDDLPCLLVSTQVVEAGVDLDFPVVYRALGPLDRIVQAAGRCNREGRLDRGECIVFELECGRQPKGTYRTGTDLARTTIKEHLNELEQPATVSLYFRDLFGMTDHDAKKIQPQRESLNYQTTANLYRLIDEHTVSLVVVHYAENTIWPLLDQATRQSGRHSHRQLQRYTVNVTCHEFEKFRSQGLAHEHEPGLFVYSGPYDDLIGIGTGSEYDPTDLVK